MKKKIQKFKMPNDLICNQALSLTTRKVAAVLYAYCDMYGVCSKSIRELAGIAGVAPGTVRKATKELSETGYISIKKNYHYDTRKSRLVRDRSSYTCNRRFQDGYSLIPYSLLRHTDLTAGTFVVCLFLHQAAGATGRAYPSISKIMALVGVANSTVCCALRALKNLPGFFVQLCKKINGAFSSSSYFITTAITAMQKRLDNDQSAANGKPKGKMSFVHALIVVAAEAVCKPLSKIGVTRFLTHQERNKITKTLHEEKKRKNDSLRKIERLHDFLSARLYSAQNCP